MLKHGGNTLHPCMGIDPCRCVCGGVSHCTSSQRYIRVHDRGLVRGGEPGLEVEVLSLDYPQELAWYTPVDYFR